ncbi:unnamed protein product [Arctia plantaginis]|uniref:Chitin-binding type-4 domain-containing protein n=1 Tax=Arctia plantaginis TaxID=874455 RepID=A0A8S0ZWQ7_ARCPL|nr:unnamed protein product [Arctia plantaginis]
MVTAAETTTPRSFPGAKTMMMTWIGLLTFACVMAYVHSHGHLMMPPNRASIWRLGYNVKPDFNDAGMNCGGISHQHHFNGGKCGICGDPYDEPRPRKHELGGIYGAGIIVAHYQPGQVMSTNVNLTAAHRGFWELRICTEPYYQEQACFDNGYLLQLVGGGTKYYPLRESGSYNVAYRLPSDLTCEHCVLQWKYTSGNNAGKCPDGTRRLGCGIQEEFYSCADIAIGESPDAKDADDGGRYMVNRLSALHRGAHPRH